MVVGASVASIQVVLTPYLAYSCRRGDIHAILPSLMGQVLLCVLVFGATMIACYRPSSVGKRLFLWSCCIRSALWAGILALFFFEVVCCCLLRFDQVPPLNNLHLNAVIVFFGLVWFLSFHILFLGATVLRRCLMPGPLPDVSEGR